MAKMTAKKAAEQLAKYQAAMAGQQPVVVEEPEAEEFQPVDGATMFDGMVMIPAELMRDRERNRAVFPGVREAILDLRHFFPDAVFEGVMVSVARATDVLRALGVEEPWQYQRPAGPGQP
jgi:hypothetical protein